MAVFAGMVYAMTPHRPPPAIAGGPCTALTVMGATAGVATAVP
ncbi:hypothetical protein [Streptosporangium sp. NPDC006007]